MPQPINRLADGPIRPGQVRRAGRWVGRPEALAWRGGRPVLERTFAGGWSLAESTYNADRRLWSAIAVPRLGMNALPIRGFGATAGLATIDVAARLMAWLRTTTPGHGPR